MKWYVANLPGSWGRLIPASLMLLLAACGGGVKLETGQAYCQAMGEDRESSDPNQTLITMCDSPDSIYIARDERTLVSLQADTIDASRGGASRPASGSLDRIATFDFKPVASISGNEMSFEKWGTSAHVKQMGDKFLLSLEDEVMWLVPARNAVADRMKLLRNELEAFDPKVGIPETDEPYVDVPLCYYEVQYRNGEKTYEDNLCHSYVTFFASTGHIATLDLDSLGTDAGPEWEIQGRWIERGGVGFPANATNFKWKLSEDGTPETELKKESSGTTYAGYGYVPSTSATGMAYPRYTGDQYDEIVTAYTEAYPKLRRFAIMSKYDD